MRTSVFRRLASARPIGTPTATPTATLLVALVALAGCAQTGSVTDVVESAGEAVATAASSIDSSTERSNKTALSAALDAQSDEHKARYDNRNPGATLEFFGVEPGMTVAEAIPGGGWYTKILVDYLGSEGAVYGVNYQDSVWASFGFPEERVKQRIEATDAFPGQVAQWTDNGIAAEGFTFAGAPEATVGTADVVLFIRALHNLHRFKDTGVLDEAITTAHDLLKPGGIVGVVQHRAPENAPDEWATGRAGYLKPSLVIAMFTQAGFTFDGTSEVNANPNDNPTTDNVVWRLPPTYSGGEETKAAMDAIGESDRMTLRFKKAS